jgi:hypothetical protein
VTRVYLAGSSSSSPNLVVLSGEMNNRADDHHEISPPVIE